MTHTLRETEASVVLEPSSPPRATVILLHGLGADGYDFVPMISELALPESLPVRFVFPHARPRSVTVNGGQAMRAWYDIKGLGQLREDDAGIRESAALVNDLIAAQTAAGIGAARIVLAGFSQGGAIALHTGLRQPAQLAGILALSTYLPLRDSLATEAALANRSTPILMCHGRQDQMIPIALASASRDTLTTLGFAIEWREYPMAHSLCAEEIADIARWLARICR